VIGRHGDLLKLAAKAANSWNDDQARETVENLKTARSAALSSHGEESWVVNRAIHFNEWADFTVPEFRDVVTAFRGLLDQLRCPKPECGSWLYVLPKKGVEESLRCRCGELNLNLTAK